MKVRELREALANLEPDAEVIVELQDLLALNDFNAVNAVKTTRLQKTFFRDRSVFFSSAPLLVPDDEVETTRRVSACVLVVEKV